MARTVKSITTKAKTKAPAAKALKATRRAAPAAKSAPKAKPAAAPKRAKAAKAPPAPKLSVGELRAQLEKLEKANATLRAKSRDAGRMAKTAAARIAELEDEVARLEKELASKTETAKPTRAKVVRAKRRSSEIDPGDAVPPGVAVEEPALPDEESEIARENLEAHLGDD